MKLQETEMSETDFPQKDLKASLFHSIVHNLIS